jgi:glycosyltransferase involved in cell wall biosynthesis
MAGWLRAYAARIGIADRVRFLGPLAHEEVLRLYDDPRIACVLMPSVSLSRHVHEGIPVALIEAMARGVPVVATRTGGIPELVREGAGFLVPERDADAIAAAIDSLIGDRIRAAELGAVGRAVVQRDFNLDVIMARLVALMEHSSWPTEGLK